MTIRQISMGARVRRAAEAFARVREKRPRVQCLTNTVAQPITANVLLAAGAAVSMATHPDEVVAMSATAGALLINLGTIDQARIDAISRVLAEASLKAKPMVLDPVFAQHAPLRMQLAETVLAARPVIVKANAEEMRALAALHDPKTTWVRTGAIDHICSAATALAVHNGHPWMMAVTGLGCAAGALIAACAAVTDDPDEAALAGMLALNIAGEAAAKESQGPGSFAVRIIDALATLSPDLIIKRARVTLEGPTV
jgi:hydroxyethylthiazole kinase